MIQDGVGPRVYRRPAAFSGRPYVQAAALVAAVSEIVLRERPRVVQVATAYDGYIGILLRRWLRLPFIVYAHGNEVLRAIGSKWQKPKLSLRQASRVLAISQFTARLVERAGATPSRIEILRPGCDTARFRVLSATAELRQRLLRERWRDQVILSVGNLVPRKGHDIVIKALPRLLLRTPNLAYLIAGEGAYRAALVDLAASLGVREHVVFLGRVSDELLPTIYGISDVFAMPSREELDACDVEGFGLVFLEASACAKPIVAGRSGGTADAVVDGVTGLLVDPKDPEDVARAIGQLLSSQDLARQMGQRGRSRVVGEYSWSQFAARLRSILVDVANE
jgi:phosphatidylinositol alpha-1,6-mannosyltransferase